VTTVRGASAVASKPRITKAGVATTSKKPVVKKPAPKKTAAKSTVFVKYGLPEWFDNHLSMMDAALVAHLKRLAEKQELSI
jgi:hypothetical protein